MLLLFRRVDTTVDCVAPDAHRTLFRQPGTQIREASQVSVPKFHNIYYGEAGQRTTRNGPLCLYVQKVMTLHGPRGP